MKQLKAPVSISKEIRKELNQLKLDWDLSSVDKVLRKLLEEKKK